VKSMKIMKMKIKKIEEIEENEEIEEEISEINENNENENKEIEEMEINEDDEIQEKEEEDPNNEENNQENNDNEEGIKEAEIEASKLNINMSEVNLKIQNLVDTISNITKVPRKEKNNVSRDTLIKELKHLLMIYYDYNSEMIELIMNLFPPNEAVEFLEANNTERIMSIRTNTLKKN